MSTKKSKFGKIKKKTKEHQENICIIFFTFLSLYLIRLQVRGDQIGLFKLVTLNCILNRITGVTFGC
jgi:hypothetical protein